MPSCFSVRVEAIRPEPVPLRGGLASEWDITHKCSFHEQEKVCIFSNALQAARSPAAH